MPSQSPLLIVFVKAPRPGSVKTRLAPRLGAEGACAAYRRLVAAVLEQIASLENVQLRLTPDDAHSEVKAWAQPGWRLAPQGLGDLGQRLSGAFEEAFADGTERVAIIGSDCPYIERADVEDAWKELAMHDLVVGPASDGGYWLVALKRGLLRERQQKIFKNISWGTGSVLEQTLDAARLAGLRVKLLREWSDVDTYEDWERFLAWWRKRADTAQ